MSKTRQIPFYLVLLATLTLLLSSGASAQLGFKVEKKATLELLADRASYAPGGKVRLVGVVEIAPGWHVNSHTPSFDYLVPTELTLTLPDGSSSPMVEYPPQEMQLFEFADDPIAVYDGTVKIFADFHLPADLDGPVDIAATLGYQACDHEQCLPPVQVDATVALTIGTEGEAINQEAFVAAIPVPAADHAASEVVPAAASTSLLGILLLAMIGGLILNAMPCVLPVLSLKIFGLVKSSSHGRAHVVAGSLATVAGILVSFWLLAGVAIAARAAGEMVGWGVLFQHPGFVTFLAVVMILFALNMWGLFEIPLPSFVAQAAGQPREGLPGHFVTGLFATLMATPCSAPFLGSAVGFALAQQAGTILAVFTAIGIGLALPYLLLAVFPGAANLLPRPGAWMVTLRGVMGFLLAAAAIWLFYVLAGQVIAESVALIQLALLTVALFTWIAHQRRQGSLGRRLATLGVVAAVIASIAIAVNAPAKSTDAVAASRHLDWQIFDEDRAESLAAAGRFVFVDVTADWCLTCKVTERVVLETQETAELFAEHQVVPMKADWTNRDDTITAFLARFGKSAVPFYVLYRPDQEPYAFGELVTRGRLSEILRDSQAVASLE